MPDPKPARPRRLRLVLALVAVGLLLFAGVSWLNRKTLAREALTGWLKARGVAAQAEVEAFGPTTFTARLTIGDPKTPDFAAERAEVRYRMTPGGLVVESVKLRRPVLRAALRQGRFSVGSLDPLVQAFLRRPPPTTRQPRMEIENGLLVLATDYGPVRVAANAVVDDSRLISLNAVSAPARLRGRDFDVEAGRATLSVASSGKQLTASLDAPLGRVRAGAATAADARLRVKLQGPYPDLRKRRGEGALVGSANVSGRQVAMGANRFARADLALAFVGQSAGWIPDLALTGRATGDLRAETGSAGEGRIGRLTAAVVASDLRWTRKGGDRVTANAQINAGVNDLAAGGLRASRLTTALVGPISADAKGLAAALTGSATGRGAWTGLGAPAPAEAAEMAAIRRAARGFALAAPGFTLTLTPQGATVGLPRPLRLVPDSGGNVELAARPGMPVFGPAGGAFRLTVAGGGLPALEADVARLALTADGASAAGRLRARASLGLVRGGEIDAAGRLATTRGGFLFTADRCVVLKAQALEFGANDVERLAGQLCPQGGPLFSMTGGDWRVAGAAQGVTAAAPFAQVRASGVAGPIRAASRGGRLTAEVDVAAGRLEDTAPSARFATLEATGRATLADYIWTADFAVRQPRGPQVGRAHVVHDGGLGVGFVTLDTDTLTFAEGGLQPAELSPMARAVGSPATGTAAFAGRFDWARTGAGSSGALSLRKLSFESPAGRVEGLTGAIAFSSLAPLVADPGQSLDVERIAAIVPLTNLNARFALTDNVLKIEGGEASVGGGRIRVESLETPLVPGAPTRGVLIFEGVQLHDLVEASPFADRVDLNAKVNGRVTFEVVDNKVRVSAGDLKAIQPGRIAIDRSALTGVTADTAVAAPGAAPIDDPNATFTDFAYQAMENLAFQTLEATVASRPDGRLGVLFHIVGRHDPPTKQGIKLTVTDLIQKRFLGRKLPLPSGTGVNLTLDTTLNLDDLLADYAEYRKLHGSGEVQP